MAPKEASSLQTRRGPSLEYNHADTLILDFQPPEEWKKKCVLYNKPHSQWYCIKTSQMD